MTKRMIIMLAIVGVILGGVFGFGIFKGMMIKKYMTSMGAPVQTVSTATAAYQDWQPLQDAIGSLRAVQGVDIANEVAGIIDELHFESGGEAKAGALLVKLRAADNEAQLQTFQAAAKLAQTIYERDKKQYAVQAVAQATLDTDSAQLNGARAQVAEQQAILDKKLIKAPFSGHLGIRNVDVGQYVNAGTAIVTLQNLDSLYLDFFLPQQALAQLKIGQKITVSSDTWPDRKFDGAISVINPKVDPATRNVQVRAELANPDHSLLPGMYATARIETGKPERHLTVPQTSISYNPYGNTVYVVVKKEQAEQEAAQKEAQKTPGEKKEEKKEVKEAEKSKDAKPGAPATSDLVAKQVFVTTGETRGDQVAVLKGLKEGDVIVTSGQLKLMNGAPVAIDNSVTPSHDAAPTPQDK